MTQKRGSIDRDNAMRELLADGRAKVVHGSHPHRKNAMHVEKKSPPHATEVR